MSIRELPHDKNSFTQGLVYDRASNTFFESSGLYGSSDLRQVSIEDGRILKRYRLEDKYFAEGIAIVGDLIYQLTWRENIIFVYDKNKFERGPVKAFKWNKEGWGMAFNGCHLIISDGSDLLYFINPKNCVMEKIIKVTYKGIKVKYLNALSWYNGAIYANVFGENSIYVIDKDNGMAFKKIDISSLAPKTTDPNAVANGIAFNADKKLMYITGKRWKNVYEIKI